MEEAEFLASLDEQIKKLNENLDTLGFDPQFNQLEKKRLAYMVYGPLPIYPLYHPYYAQAPDFKPTDAFYNKLVSAITEDEALIGMNWYQEALIGRPTECTPDTLMFIDSHTNPIPTPTERDSSLELARSTAKFQSFS